jgi:hypothetical protein
MKNGLVYLIIGFTTTLVAILVLFLISTHGGSNIKFIGPYSFGNVLIWQKKEKEVSDETYNFGTLVIALDKIPFLYLSASKNGNVEGLSVFKKNKLLFAMTSSPLKGRWCLLHYSGISLEDEDKVDCSGERYTDINYDGCFDLKYVFKSGIKSKYIYKDGDWLKIEKHGDKKAIVADGRSFIFDSNSGWQQN